MKYEKLFFSSGFYTLFLYALINPTGLKDTFFFFTKDNKVPLFIRRKLPCIVLKVEHCPGFMGRLKELYNYLIVLYFASFHKRSAMYLVSNGYFIHFFDNIIAIEDGLYNYRAYNDVLKAEIVSRKYNFLNHIIGPIYPDFGYSEKVSKIYMTGIEKIPDLLVGKSEIIDIKKLWEKKSLDQQSEIIEFFFPEEFDISQFIGKRVVLLTQSLSEDHWLPSEQCKIDLYKKAILSFDESEIVIKTHPREMTNYSVHFPKALVISYPCPMELLNLIGLDFEVAISYNSTSIYNLPDSVRKIMLERDSDFFIKR